MHPGVADAAERDQVPRIVVRGVVVEMMDVEVAVPVADGAPVAVTCEDRVADLLPSQQSILLPRPDGNREPIAVDQASAPRGKRAPAAEPAKTVQVGTISAERGLRAVERVQAQLEVGAHDQKKVGCGMG